MNSLLSDLHYALRGFSRRSGLTAVVVVTLALGIGSNTAIFSVANSVLFQSLPYRDPESLVLAWTRSASASQHRSMVSGPDLLDYQSETTMFEDFAGAVAINGTITGEGRAEQLMMGWCTENLFQVLGVRPIVGRDFEKEDLVPIDPQEFQDPNAKIPPGVLLLSHALWRERFGGDSEVIGRGVELDGHRNFVVGVLPPDFRIYLPDDAGMPTNVDVWRVLPVEMDSSPRNAAWLTVVGRLKEGVSLEQAQSEMDALAARLREQHQFHANAGMQIELNSMHQDVVRHVRPVLYALLAAGGFVLLIACANVANLLLSRAASREREIAVRAALGGGQGRIIRLMLVESGVLSLAGGLAGLGLAWAGIRMLLTIRPEHLPRLEQVGLDGTVLVFTFGLTLLAGVVSGLAPAVKASKPNLSDSLKDRGSGTAGIRSNKLRASLVVLEVALSMVLLIGAGLLLRSFVALQRVEPGFETDNVLTFSLPLPAFKYRTPQPRIDFYLEVQRRLEALPGVRAAGSVSPLPLAGGDQYYVFSYGPIGVSETEWSANKADYRWVVPGYFEAMGIRLVAGRLLTEADNREGARPVVLIDEPLARRTWPGGDPVDQQLQIERFKTEDFALERATVQVAGVVEHVRSESLAAEGREAIYFPLGSFPYVPQSYAVAAAGAGDLGRVIRSEVQSLDPDVP
ncbi:MAG: ABC transporter permease, partial [Acidobacteriota bacterium]